MEIEPAEKGHPFFSMSWQGFAEGVSSSSGGIGLEVTNISDEERYFELRFLFTGLIDKVKDVDVDRARLSPGESMTFSLSAAEIPLQTRSGACQAHAMLEPVDPESGERRGDAQGLPPILYRHSPSFDSIEIFDEKYLVEHHDGSLTGEIASESLSAMLSAELGRMKNSAGEMETVSVESGSNVVMSGGQVVGVILESGVEYAEGVAIEESGEVSDADE